MKEKEDSKYPPWCLCSQPSKWESGMDSDALSAVLNKLCGWLAGLIKCRFGVMISKYSQFSNAIQRKKETQFIDMVREGSTRLSGALWGVFFFSLLKAQICIILGYITSAHSSVVLPRPPLGDYYFVGKTTDRITWNPASHVPRPLPNRVQHWQFRTMERQARCRRLLDLGQVQQCFLHRYWIFFNFMYLSTIKYVH